MFVHPYLVGELCTATLELNSPFGLDNLFAMSSGGGNTPLPISNVMRRHRLHAWHSMRINEFTNWGILFVWSELVVLASSQLILLHSLMVAKYCWHPLCVTKCYLICPINGIAFLSPSAFRIAVLLGQHKLALSFCCARVAGSHWLLYKRFIAWQHLDSVCLHPPPSCLEQCCCWQLDWVLDVLSPQ